ncbi:tetratricopeptide repeat protein [Shimia litoralis]|uniref:Tetratricopeptide repeat protein n=1 Tax=Shimia litoralis TaxID=420403 RepID=A0A4U7N825_9RHOB|nr:tetratricopeptide repeat protein [Shimia litoralis]TKZ21506.1 tetratricopeptide repeat protein [Shimia litoralis]
MKQFAFIICIATPAFAQACPQAPDHSAALERLIAQVQVAPNEMAAQEISNEMWAYWADAPDEVAQQILDRGMQKRGGFDYLGALEEFDALVEYCPHYAEGYNQRAFVNFLRRDFAAALPDLERALELSPRHVGALSGRAITLIGLGQDAAAQDALAAALEVNPWLPERGLLRAPQKDNAVGQDL